MAAGAVLPFLTSAMHGCIRLHWAFEYSTNLYLKLAPRLSGVLSSGG